MLVYRVETINGVGPYRADIIADDTPSTPTHPTPQNDGIDWWKVRTYPFDDYYCGFVSIEQLKEWFAMYYHALVNGLCRVAVYKIHHKRVLKGKHQCIFVKHLAERLTCEPFDKVFDRGSIAV